MGRPSLHVVIGVLLLQQLHDRAMQRPSRPWPSIWRGTMPWTCAAKRTAEKTLRNYRRLFIEQGLDELLFRCLTDRLVQGFSVDTSHQRMDSTALRSAMRALTRLGIVVESISKFARELERYHPGPRADQQGGDPPLCRSRGRRVREYGAECFKTPPGEAGQIS